MKKMIVAGLLAVACTAMSQQQASAWVNSKFSIGLNWDMQSANNSVLWGLWRNGQIPAPGPDMGMGGMPGGIPRFVPPPYPPYGGVPHANMPPQGYPPQAYMPPTQAYMPPAFAPRPGMPQGYAPNYQSGGFDPSYNNAQHASYTYESLYHFANNPRPVYYYQGTWYNR